MKQYPRTFSEDSSYGSALRLLDRAGAADGVVLDLGCGRSPLAEPLAERGLVHVGCDVDTAALADLAERGFETHRVSLLDDDAALLARLGEVLGDRRLAAVLCLDVLEHLPDPVEALLAVRRFVLDRRGDAEPAPLVVSIPNVTHADVGAKLVLGRWDVDDTGLLDDTHLRFFGVEELGRLLTAGGWSTADVEDVTLEISDQAFPTDAPSVRPGAPLRELLRAVRGRADAHACTYQFVRRLTVGEPAKAPYHVEVDEARPLLGAIVVTGPGATEADAAALVADLAAQVPAVDDVRLVPREELDDALRGTATRWVAVLDPATRLAPGWAARVAELAELAAGHVIQLGGVTLPDAALRELPGTPVDPSALTGADRLAAGVFDPLHVAAPEAVAVSTFLVPAEVVGAAGVVPGPERALGAERSLWLVRAIQVSGVLVSDDPLVVVGRSSMIPVGAGAEVTEALDGEPLLLPVGSARRLDELRNRVLAAEGALAAAEGRAAAAEYKAAHYAEHLGRVEAERDADRTELDQLRAAEQQRAGRRLRARLRLG